MLPLVILSGPTAAGKTKLSLDLAKAIGGEIISADSMQVYRGMDIGTAKLPFEYREGVPHHLIDCLEPDEEFNVTVFVKLAKEAIQQIRGNNHIPILVGGTGFYIQALVKDLDFEEEPHEDGYRDSLEQIAAEGNAHLLYEQLQKVDPDSAESIPKENVKRIIRALEYYHYHNETIFAHNERQRQKPSPYNYLYFVLTRNRELLYKAIDQRVEDMFEQGLLEEVAALKEKGYHIGQVSMQGLGYRQLLKHLNGECTLEEAKYAIQLETRHFAKRQLTWFRREGSVIWLNKDEFPSEEAVLDMMLRHIRDKKLI